MLEPPVATERAWEQCYKVALQQNVLAMTFPALSQFPKDQRPSFALWSKWMAYAQHTAEQFRHKRDVVRRVGGWLSEDGLSTTVIKGFSLSELYPVPDLREFGDIDIYSGDSFEAVNACLAKQGLSIGAADGHHLHVKVEGVSLEHHFAFGNSRVRSDMFGLEDTLHRLVKVDRQITSQPGIFFPNQTFTALYVGLHAYKHFLNEKIELRHVIDWTLAMRQLSEEDASMLQEMAWAYPWSRFADVLTAIALHKLMLPEEWFPKPIRQRVQTVSHEQERRVLDDILGARHTSHYKSKNRRRMAIARRLMQNGWKFDAYADESASRFLFKEFLGYCKRK